MFKQKPRFSGSLLAFLSVNNSDTNAVEQAFVAYIHLRGAEKHTLFFRDKNGKSVHGSRENVHCFSAFWSLRLVNGVVYVGSWDHKLYAFHLPGAMP